MIRDLTDDELRRAMILKWGSVDPDVLPAWVAEMDYATAPPVLDAIRRAVEDGVLGYPPFEGGGGPLGEAYAGFARRHYGQDVDPEQVLPTVDVTAGVRVALDVLSDDGAGGAADAGLPPAVRRHPDHGSRACGTCRSPPMPSRACSTSTGSTTCSRAEPGRCS